MRKFTLSLVFLLAMVMGGYSQVTVGEGTNTSQNLPINPFYGYSYSQSIYLSSEINATGSISSIQWYYAGSGALTNSQNLTIYLGQTEKLSFDSASDFVLLSELTAVYTGGLPTGSTAGWKTIVFTTPFAYDGVANLVVATDENMPSYDTSTDKFYNSAVATNRSIVAFADGTNPDPANPTVGSFTRSMVAFVPNIIFGGITQVCANPTLIVTSNPTTTQATVTWTASSGQSQWEVYVVAQGESAPTTTTIGAIVNNDASYTKTGLNPNTAYHAYVRTTCSESQKSGWAGPAKFRTLCSAFEEFTEDLTNTTAGTGIVPNCWTKTISSTNSGVNISVVSNTYASAPNAIFMTNSSDVNAKILLVSPALTALGSNTHRMKFKARGGTAGQLLIMGTMSDPTNADSFVPFETISLGNTYNSYSFNVSTSTTDSHIAFKHGLGGTSRSIYLDDVEWELIPTNAPECIDDMNAVVNADCGNFPTTFTWSAVPGADGYKVSIGTSAQGQDLVVNELNIYNVLNYSFVGTPGTTYYYTIKPYNAFGDAEECYEDNFTTSDDGCYCVSVPTSNDALGISNVKINQVSTTVGDVLYGDFTESQAIGITQGVTTIMNVTLATNYGYWTDVWVDFNDNYIFEPSELVHASQLAVGVSPIIANTSFITPLTAQLGNHRMRIVSSDSKKTPANPCYNGGYAVTLDFLVNVLPAPSCLPPTSGNVTNITATTAQLNWDSTATLYNVEVVFAVEAQGSGTVMTGVNGNTTTFTNLNPQSDYAFYVQTDCGEVDGLSPWVGPFTFRTGCASFGDFTEDFETAVNYNAPECWSTILDSSDPYSLIRNYSSNDYMQFYTANDPAANLYLITPSLSDLPSENYRIKFKAYSPTAGQSVIVGTMSDPSDSNTFTAVQTVQLTNAFADYAVSFSNSTTDTHVAFKFVGTAKFQYLYLDDVIWEANPACPDIFVVSFDGATATTANVSWIPGNNETAWQYVYAISTETDPNVLTPVDVVTAATTITNLASNTSYKVWIRSACGSDFGNWSPAKTFVTGCVPVSEFPWIEGFESLTTVGSSSFPLCWIKENGDYATANVGTTGYTSPRTGTNYLRNSWSATNEYMWTPGFELIEGVSYDFSFYMQGDGFTGWNVDVFQNNVQNSIGATQLGNTTTASGSGALVLQPYALVTNTFVAPTSDVYYFAVRTNQASSAPYYIGFDDFKMEPTPTCIAPLAPTATDVTISEATMNWTATNPEPGNGYDYYVTSEIAVPNASTVPTGTVGSGVTTAALTGLNGSTIYKIYVRSICEANDISSWSYAGTFATLCTVTGLPYAIDFESVVVPGLPLCTSIENAGSGNNWKTQANPGYGFDSKVLNYSFSSSSVANAWFYTNTLSLVAGTTYTVSYQYGNAGIYPEKMKVSYGTAASAIEMTNEISNHTSINTGTMQSNITTFTPETSGIYVIGFNAYSDADHNQLYLDNILIQEDLGFSDFDNKSFTTYPNPVKDILNVSFTQNISDIKVFNLLGQQVLFMNMNANKGQVDMSALSSGSYLVKVNTDNGVKTVKVIKE